MAKIKGVKSGLDTIEIGIDLTPILYPIAGAQALNRGLKHDTYIDALMDTAFEKADAMFDQEADAMALTGAISHMYEWGTVGVNTGKTNMRMRTSNPNSRLWTNYSWGTGLDRSISFVYRPSLANVPKPSASQTGMDASVIEALRPQQFTWKAKILEEGQTVTISPKEAEYLLIPATQANRANANFTWRTNDIARGYLLTRGPLVTDHSKGRYYGNFEKLWYSFWLDRAPDIIEADVNKMIEDDYFPSIFQKVPPLKMRPAKAWNVRAEVEERAQSVHKRALAKRRLKARAARKKKRKMRK